MEEIWTTCSARAQKSKLATENGRKKTETLGQKSREKEKWSSGEEKTAEGQGSCREALQGTKVKKISQSWKSEIQLRPHVMMQNCCYAHIALWYDVVLHQPILLVLEPYKSKPNITAIRGAVI